MKGPHRDSTRMHATCPHDRCKTVKRGPHTPLASSGSLRNQFSEQAPFTPAAFKPDGKLQVEVELGQLPSQLSHTSAHDPSSTNACILHRPM